MTIDGEMLVKIKETRNRGSKRRKHDKMTRNKRDNA